MDLKQNLMNFEVFVLCLSLYTGLLLYLPLKYLF